MGARSSGRRRRIHEGKFVRSAPDKLFAVQDVLAGVVPELVVFDALAEQRHSRSGWRRRPGAPRRRARARTEGLVVIEPGEEAVLHPRARYPATRRRPFGARRCFARRRRRFAEDALHRSALPNNCRPTGNRAPSSLKAKPQGTLTPQMPVRFAGMVKMSARYICSGSESRAPILKAGIGEVGERTASTCWKTRVKSRRISSPDFLRAQIVGVVIAGAEHVGAKNDPALHLRAESFRPRPFVMIEQSLRLVRPGAVTHAVEAREIGRSFRGREDVIGRHGVVGVRQRDLDDLCA